MLLTLGDIVLSVSLKSTAQEIVRMVPKILSLIIGTVLLVLQFQSERAAIKWTGVVLCIALLGVGAWDAVSSSWDQQRLTEMQIQDSTRINWEETTIKLHLPASPRKVSLDHQQVMLKIFPATYMNEALPALVKSAEESPRGVGVLDEHQAATLFEYFYDKSGDGGDPIGEQTKLGVESFLFERPKVVDGPAGGAEVVLSPWLGPSATLQNGSLHDLEGKIIVLRIASRGRNPTFIGSCDLVMKTSRGPMAIYLPAKPRANEVLQAGPVRFVGAYLLPRALRRAEPQSNIS